MELKEVMDAFDKIEGKMSETSASNKARLDELGEQQRKFANQILELQQKGVKVQNLKAEEKSAGKQFVESDNFKHFFEGSTQKARVELKEEAASIKEAQNPILTPTGSIIQAYRRPGILPGAFRPLTIEGLFPEIPLSTNAFEYVQEKPDGFVNGAAFIAEGAQKPFGSTEFEVKTGTVKTIAHLARISKQLMADGPALVAYINQRLVYGVDLKVEDELVSGDGTGQNLTGIFTEGNFTKHEAKAADLDKSATLFDLILFAKTKVERAFFRPNLILMNPVDWSQMLMQKNKSGDYYLGHPASVAPKTLWGLPIWTTPAIAEGKFMVGDFTQAATLYPRQGMTVEMFEQDADNVQKNLVTIRAERRLGFGIERVAAMVGGDLALPTA